MNCSHPGCRIQISDKYNKTGLCSYHLADLRTEQARAARVKCKHPQCEQLVSHGSRTGYCRIHAQTERKRKK